MMRAKGEAPNIAILKPEMADLVLLGGQPGEYGVIDKLGFIGGECLCRDPLGKFPPNGRLGWMNTQEKACNS
jgi:hypothetical protein